MSLVTFKYHTSLSWNHPRPLYSKTEWGTLKWRCSFRVFCILRSFTSRFYLSSRVPHITIRVYISKIADSTISAGVSKNSCSIARCVCNASIIFVLLPSNLRNILDSNASFDITITFPFYLKYSQTVLQDLSKERTFSKNFRLFYLSVSVRFTKTNVRSYNWEYKGFKSRQTD